MAGCCGNWAFRRRTGPVARPVVTNPTASRQLTVTWQTRAHKPDCGDRPVREGEGGRGARVHQGRCGRAGHHGRRHRRGLRPLGHRRRRASSRRGRAGARAGRRSPAPPTGPSPGASSTEADRDALLGADHLRRRAGRPARRATSSSRPCPSSSTSSSGSSPSWTGSAGPRRSSPPTPPRCRVTEISVATSRPRPGRRPALLQPGAGMKLVEVVRTVVTAAEVVADVEALCARLGKADVTIGDRAGFIANALLFGYLNHAVRDVRGALRHPRGHRRGDAARLRPADGPARADGPDRPGHRVRDPRHDVPPRRRATAGTRRRRCSSRWSPPGCSAASPAAASTPTRQPGSPVVVRRRADAGRRRRAGDGARPVAHGRRGRLRHDGHRHRRGLRQGRLRRRRRDPGRGEVRAVREAVELSLDKAVLRGKLDRGRPRRRARPDHRLDRARRPADVDLVVEAVVEELAVKQALFATLDEICKPGAVLATTTSLAAGRSSARWPPSARPT